MTTKPIHSDGTSKSWSFLRRQRIDRREGEPYLLRIILLRCPWFAVYLHFFLGDDELCPHSHPWNWFSVILWGGYWEWVPVDHPEGIGPLREMGKWYWPGTILRRPAHWVHRIERGRWLPITLVITGRRKQSWGFYTPKGFIPWRQFSSKEHCA